MPGAKSGYETLRLPEHFPCANNPLRTIRERIDLKEVFDLSTTLPPLSEEQSRADSVAERSDISLGERFASLRAEILQHKETFADKEVEQATGGPGSIQAQSVLDYVALRKRRSELFASKLFSDPAWDLLLVAFATTLQGGRLTISELCASVDMPNSTAHRWITKLIDERLLERRGDLFDGRLSWLNLSPSALRGLTTYFEALEIEKSFASSKNSPSK